MKHRVAGRKLGRTSAHRLALMRNLSTSLFDKERVTTTLMKAKELRPFAERLVTLAKRETLHARRQVLRHIRDRRVVAKLVDTLSARYAQRPGGYTRILKLAPRRGDHAAMAVIELVGAEPHGQAQAEVPTKQPEAAGVDQPAKAPTDSRPEARDVAPRRQKAGGAERKRRPAKRAEPKSKAAGTMAARTTSAKKKAAAESSERRETPGRRSRKAGKGSERG
jgi:large subunit ribosomal protein L17